MRDTRGITLIALIVTIIALLILAGVTISMITTGGIPFGKIKEGANKYNQAILNETEHMNEIYNILNGEEENTVNGPSIDTSNAIQVNAPVLAEGMTPIVWDEVKQEWVETTTNAGWYSYEEQTGTTEQPGSGTSKWANVKMPDGSTFVWIPRYAYQITEGYHTGGEGVKGVIDVVFIKNTTYTDFSGNSNYGGPTTVPTYSGDKQTNWIVHPVFRANTNMGGWTSELSGIWVAKFEASNTDEYGEEYTNADNIKLTMQILPNKVSWRSITANHIFQVSQNANYGYITKPSKIDSHMMKNTEWGAVAYLAHSKYGRSGTEVSINNAYQAGNNVKTYTTGYSAGINISATKTDATYSYETLQGQLASTTGNIYGIYDICGGAWENVAGIYMGSEVNSTTQEYYSYISNAQEKYKNTYLSAMPEQYGDAVYETSTTADGQNAWFYDYSYFPTAINPVVGRGGYMASDTIAGLFSYGYYTGGAHNHRGFRTVLVI